MSCIDNYRYSRNPTLFIIVLIFGILNIIDIFTALFILPGEANPLFIMTGSMLPVFIGKILIVVLAIWIYKQNKFPSNFQYFMILSFLVLGSLLLTLGVGSNIYGMINTDMITEAAKISNAEKLSYYWQISFLFYFIPLGFNLLVFKLYEKSIGKVIIKKKY